MLSVLVLAGAILAVERRWEASGAGDGGGVLTAGSMAPDATVALRGGGTWSPAAHRGAPIWINIWATWCLPCRAEFPEIDELYRAAAPFGLELIAINFQESNEAIVTYLDHTGYSVPIGLDPNGAFARAYGIEGLPAHVFISEDGTVNAVRIGGMSRPEMERQLEALLGRPVRSEASSRQD